MQIQNPHDKFFKETFSNIEVAKDFVINYLPQSIMDIVDINTLEVQKDSFINADLEEAFSDMLFKINVNKQEGYLYFLFEHKSYVSKNITIQLLKYMIEIWETKAKKENIRELPMIIPLVIYHGNNEWKIKTSLGEMINGYDAIPEDVKKYVPDYEYLFYDLSRYTDEQIKGEVKLRIVLTIFRDIFTKDSQVIRKSILRATEHLRELDDKQTGIEYFETFIRYVLNAGQKLTKKEMNDIIGAIETTFPEGSETVMTLAEQFKQEGREEGIQEGIQEGEANALAKMAIRLLTKKFGSLSEDNRIKIKKLDSVTLEIIIDEILEYKNLDEVNKYLGN